jgi:hypothetical protein
MSYLSVETYITLLIHFVKKNAKNKDALAWVMNCNFYKCFILLSVTFYCIYCVEKYQIKVYIYI